MSGYLDWQVGDRVVCVDASGSMRLEEGRDYQIEAIKGGVFFDANNEVVDSVGIKLVGVHLSDGAWFNAVRFRKVEPRKTDISMLERFLKNADAPIREEVG